MSERRDIGYRLAGWLCQLLGHQWRDWTGKGDERCARCLRWKAGHPPRLS